ncbi:NiFe hydrogenase [Methanomicrobiaceae archaeon CYW5]|uniref:DUF2107 family protein n=1 Tax=Methanovulcanius yangii TaxID=1789227 RepID=UPI0029CA8A7E|nr:DUF2107 family protein [Methanovulcanius yangii]MBT8507353.1 NiFe hydrogenase [Methanovulcanius yangii]
MTPEFILGLLLLVIGIGASVFPRTRNYLDRLINVEVAATGLMLVLLSFDETIALLTFVAVTTLATAVLVRVIERRCGI